MGIQLTICGESTQALSKLTVAAGQLLSAQIGEGPLPKIPLKCCGKGMGVLLFCWVDTWENFGEYGSSGVTLLYLGSLAGYFSVAAGALL